MKSLFFRAGTIVASLVSGAGLVHAQSQFPGPAAQLPPATNVQFSTISSALCTLVAWVFTVLIILAVIFILWAAWLYLNSGGEEEKIRKANHQLLYAAIAIIVAILSRGIPFLVGQFLGANTFQGC